MANATSVLRFTFHNRVVRLLSCSGTSATGVRVARSSLPETRLQPVTPKLTPTHPVHTRRRSRQFFLKVVPIKLLRWLFHPATVVVASKSKASRLAKVHVMLREGGK